MPGPIEFELVSVPNLILNKARSIANSVNPTNDIVDIVSINALVNETDATERGIEYYLDINSKRLDFDFYSTLGPVDLVTVTTGPCYRSRKFRLRHNYNPILQTYTNDANQCKTANGITLAWRTL